MLGCFFALICGVSGFDCQSNSVATLPHYWRCGKEQARYQFQVTGDSVPDSNHEKIKILLTGATGYVGGRLLPLLEQSGSDIRCMSRRPESLRDVVAANTETVFGDALDAPSINSALDGVHTAYYLVHSMGSDADFEETDRLAAELFAEACTAQEVKRIIYLGGLGNPDHKLSKHLRSRQEIGNILRTSSAAVVEFRASIIIGSGSLSFEMIRALVEQLPVMICPKWVRVMAQPIAIEDVLAYLMEAQSLPIKKTVVFEIGGPDQLSYGEIMQLYARLRGLRRWMIPGESQELDTDFQQPCRSLLYRRAAHDRTGDRASVGLRGATICPDTLVRCDIRGRKDEKLGWCAFWLTFGRFAHADRTRWSSGIV